MQSRRPHAITGLSLSHLAHAFQKMGIACKIEGMIFIDLLKPIILFHIIDHHDGLLLLFLLGLGFNTFGAC